RRTVQQINALESPLQALDDASLRARTDEFRARLAKGETLDQLLPEAFAVVREAGKRTLKMRHFDVQLIGGMVLHQGKIAEMRTGEGKTLMATLPVYLNALSGKGVHVVTVNDYLARRDAEWMGRLYGFLGLTVGVNVPGMARDEKQAAFAADVTYGTNNEFGFDYLRDNMVYEVAERVARGLNFAIVDEVDSILIDEARTPLIISGQAEDHTELYVRINAVVPQLKKQIGEADPRTGEGVIEPGDFTVDEKAHQVVLTESGHEKAEAVLAQAGLLAEGASLYDAANISLMHHVYAALRARHLYNRDQHYVVQNGEVVIVDEFTGRLMTGRRWSDGLHQAVEAKEGVQIQSENQTLASVTFQNYFRMYGKLAGMTGTADTEAYEFQEIYGLETVVIPPNKPTIRKDDNDLIYKTTKEKYDAVTRDIRDCFERGQPVLVGTTSIENSELISSLLTQAKLPHQVLNAKQHAKEAEIVAQAGRPKMITIATNMAGRGTDIVLGGNVEKQVQFVEDDASLSADEKRARADTLKAEWQGLHDQVKAQGGLRIVATERHESRRIDNQLRGRSGRQGDPGESRFYLSLEDELMKRFASGAMSWVMDRAFPDDMPLEARMVTKAIERAQNTVEGRNFEIRKDVLKYDEVLNEQRKIIYAKRQQILDGGDIHDQALELIQDAVQHLVDIYCAADFHEEWELDELVREAGGYWPCEVTTKQLEDVVTKDGIYELLAADALAKYQHKEETLGGDDLREVERRVMLSVIDTRWREHLSEMDYLREGINLRAMGQRDPLSEWQREGYDMFEAMVAGVDDDFVRYVGHLQVLASAPQQASIQLQYSAADDPVAGASGMAAAAAVEPGAAPAPVATAVEEPVNAPVRVEKTPGRNEPCWCGSGKKYKLCHGK
ncbi:MAG: preprotein translocase subunit SecA, partial [Rubrivivax sp.]|nr:preprotein translocase subunit SecA [Rubrivivax sp.]